MDNSRNTVPFAEEEKVCRREAFIWGITESEFPMGNSRKQIVSTNLKLTTKIWATDTDLRAQTTFNALSLSENVLP